MIELYSRISNYGFPYVYLNSSSGALQTCQWRGRESRDSRRVIPEQIDDGSDALAFHSLILKPPSHEN